MENIKDKCSNENLKSLSEESCNLKEETENTEIKEEISNKEEISDFKEEKLDLTLLKSKLDEMEENYLRAKAETENIRRRSHEDILKAHKFAIENFAENLLPVIDSLEAAMSDKSEDIVKSKEGIELTLRQLKRALEKGRIIQINPIGEKFDPHLHQAISMVPSEGEPNTIVTVLQKGYKIIDRILRPALVIVSQKKE